jgi:hypothetical protein
MLIRGEIHNPHPLAQQKSSTLVELALDPAEMHPDLIEEIWYGCLHLRDINQRGNLRSSSSTMQRLSQ